MRMTVKASAVAAAGVIAAVGLSAPASGSTQEARLGAAVAAEAKQAGLSTAEAAGMQKKVDAQLARTPGAQQTGVNEITSVDGQSVMTLPLPGEKKARGVDEAVGALGTANCAKYYTCLYEHKDFNGRRLAWKDCNFNHLRDWDFTDKTSSYHNNQSRGTKTYVYNWTSSGWSTLWISTAPSSSSYVGNSKNDKADSLTVC